MDKRTEEVRRTLEKRVGKLYKLYIYENIVQENCGLMKYSTLTGLHASLRKTYTVIDKAKRDISRVNEESQCGYLATI